MNNKSNMQSIILGAVLGAIIMLSVGAATTTASRMVWEYKTVSSFNVTDDELNKLGNEGWELVGFSFTPRSQTGNNNSYSRYVFKRMK